VRVNGCVGLALDESLGHLGFLDYVGIELDLLSTASFLLLLLLMRLYKLVDHIPAVTLAFYCGVCGPLL